MKHYKAFREQFKECEVSGNLIKIDMSCYGKFPKKALICLKYKSVCHSGVCRAERGVNKSKWDDFKNEFDM